MGRSFPDPLEFDMESLKYPSLLSRDESGALKGLLILLIWALMLFVGLFYISSSGILATMGLGCCLASMFFLSLVEPYVWLLNRPAGKISASLFFISFIRPTVEMAPMVPRLL